MLVSETMGDQIVLAYSKAGLVMVFVVTSVSFCFPHLVPVSALMIVVVLLAFSLMILMCSE